MSAEPATKPVSERDANQMEGPIMSMLSRLTNYAADYQARRRRMRTYLQIAELPPEIRKDIGWTMNEGQEPTPRTWHHGA